MGKTCLRCDERDALPESDRCSLCESDDLAAALQEAHRSGEMMDGYRGDGL